VVIRPVVDTAVRLPVLWVGVVVRLLVVSVRLPVRRPVVATAFRLVVEWARPVVSALRLPASLRRE
jgi:hypothetical protein